MPELPEVETVKRGLSPVMQGRVLSRVEVRRPKIRIDIPKNFSEAITGTTIHSLERRSKYLWIHLNSGQTIIIHLGMSGRMTIDPDSSRAIEKHDHVSFYLADGAAVHFTDPRRFGIVTLCATANLDAHDFFKKMGPEPLSNQWSAAGLFEAISKRRSPIKTVLLDQNVVAGLGNIYVCEALFRARIHPKTQACSLTQDDCDRLVPIVRDVLSEAIESGGSTLRDYVRSDGGLGYFQHAFQVYGREGEPCLTEGCDSVIERMVQSNRSTFFCPSCQSLV